MTHKRLNALLVLEKGGYTFSLTPDDGASAVAVAIASAVAIAIAIAIVLRLRLR